MAIWKLLQFPRVAAPPPGAPRVEPTFFEAWARQPEIPVLRKGPHAVYQQAVFVPGGLLTEFTESNWVEAWGREQEVPVLSETPHPSTWGWQIKPVFIEPPVVAPDYGWYRPLDEPVRLAPRRQSHIAQPSGSPSNWVEPVWAEAWNRLPTLPVRRVPRAPDFPGFFYVAEPTIYPVVPSYGWWRPASEPVRTRPYVPPSGYYGLSFTPTLPAPVVPDFGWWQPSAMPVRGRAVAPVSGAAEVPLAAIIPAVTPETPTARGNPARLRWGPKGWHIINVRRRR